MITRDKDLPPILVVEKPSSSLSDQTITNGRTDMRGKRKVRKDIIRRIATAMVRSIE